MVAPPGMPDGPVLCQPPPLPDPSSTVEGSATRLTRPGKIERHSFTTENFANDHGNGSDALRVQIRAIVLLASMPGVSVM